jgi:NAD(P)-dependent dehydrogenase (short-subunit alcohol dehydrogenase family)
MAAMMAGKVAIVTGGSGIGQATALRFAREGSGGGGAKNQRRGTHCTDD